MAEGRRREIREARRGREVRRRQGRGERGEGAGKERGAGEEGRGDERGAEGGRKEEGSQGREQGKWRRGEERRGEQRRGEEWKGVQDRRGREEAKGEEKEEGRRELGNGVLEADEETVRVFSCKQQKLIWFIRQKYNLSPSGMEAFAGNRLNSPLPNVKPSRTGFRWMLMPPFPGTDSEACTTGTHHATLTGGLVTLA